MFGHVIAVEALVLLLQVVQSTLRVDVRCSEMDALEQRRLGDNDQAFNFPVGRCIDRHEPRSNPLRDAPKTREDASSNPA